MKMTKPMLKAFILISHGENTIAKVAKEFNKSTKWTNSVINSLEDEEFIVKKRNYRMQGSRFLIDIAPTSYAQKLRELLFEYAGISLEGVLTEGRLSFLATVSEDWMSLPIALKLSGISKYSIERYRPTLLKRGILKRKKRLYIINKEGWPLLKEFIVTYKNYSTVEGVTHWKYGEETIFEVQNEKRIQGSVTGLNAYKQYGVQVGVISSLCVLPQRKLTKEEIFVHSLFEIHDTRTLHLAFTFYLKNKLSDIKVMPLAMKYGKYTMFESFMKLLTIKEDKLKLEGLPLFDRKDFIRIARMYGVNHVH